MIYTGQTRHGLPGLPNPLPAFVEHASTEAYAILLADTVRTRLDATWGIGESGATHPVGNRYGDAAGHCCTAITGPVTRVITIETEAVDWLANLRSFGERALALLAEAMTN